MKQFSGKGIRLLKLHAILGLFYLCTFCEQINAQPISITHLNSDSYRESKLKYIPFESSIAYTITDTLALPFFEDFSYDHFGFPDNKKWCDIQVWVNPNFGVT